MERTVSTRCSSWDRKTLPGLSGRILHGALVENSEPYLVWADGFFTEFKLRTVNPTGMERTVTPRSFSGDRWTLPGWSGRFLHRALVETSEPYLVGADGFSEELYLRPVSPTWMEWTVSPAILSAWEISEPAHLYRALRKPEDNTGVNKSPVKSSLRSQIFQNKTLILKF